MLTPTAPFALSVSVFPAHIGLLLLALVRDGAVLTTTAVVAGEAHEFTPFAVTVRLYVPASIAGVDVLTVTVFVPYVIEL